MMTADYTLESFGTIRYVETAKLEDNYRIYITSLYSSSGDDTTPVITPEYLSGSDYNGGTVTRSNYEAFLDKFEDVPGVYEYYGAMGTYGIVLTAQALENEEIVDVLRGLEDYPLVDEDAHSQMEYEVYQESWSNWGCREFVSELRREFELDYCPRVESLIEDANEDVMMEFYESLIPSGEYYVSESGYDSVTLFTRRAAKDCTLQKFVEFVKSLRHAD